MPQNVRPTPFAAGPEHTTTLPSGARAHEAHVAQTERLDRRLYEVTDGVWSLVGNGLSNQSFVEAPEGIIAIDTGESNEEMHDALDELTSVSDRPVVAVLYTHFHYVAGTQAVVDRFGDVPVFGHAWIDRNRARTASSIATAYGRGLIEQFGMTLPDEGPDALVNVGLGHWFRNPAHAPFTGGYVSPTVAFDAATTIEVAGLSIDVMPAPSDADDSVTFWFPDRRVAVNNLVWPALFNVFAIRGEEYRDPRMLLDGLDHLLDLEPTHLVGTHGPPISGPDLIERTTRYRDSIQFLWDQTVRHTNKGATSDELGHLVQLPAACDEDPITSQLYGVAEHHVRQIRTGLFGFFDGATDNLFPSAPADRADRIVAGFGGPEAVRAQAEAALADGDLRWAAELGTWLVDRSDRDDGDRVLLANVLRSIGQRTTSANVRNWCLTRARDLDGSFPRTRYVTHRLPARMIAADPVGSLDQLRVLLVPGLAEGIDTRLAFDFGEAGTCGLHVRNQVAVPGAAPSSPDATITCAADAWASVLAGKQTLSEAQSGGAVAIIGDESAAATALAAFDVAGLQA